MRFELLQFILNLGSDSPAMAQVKVLLLPLRLGQNWHFTLVHFMRTLVELLVKEVDCLGVSLLHSGKSMSEALGLLDLREYKMGVCLGLGVGMVPLCRNSSLDVCVSLVLILQSALTKMFAMFGYHRLPFVEGQDDVALPSRSVF